MQDRKPGILIVDDVLPNIKLLSAILSRGNYRIYGASNGPDAIELARKFKPILIILDVMMPGMDGYAVCERLKDSPETKDIAVIFVSAKNTAEDKVKGLEVGAVDYIVKPFQKAEVIARVETHISLQSARRRLNDSEQRHATLIENLKDGIFLWTPSSDVFYANPALLKMTGNASSKGRLPALEDFIHPDELGSFERRLLDALSAENPKFDEMQVRMVSPHSKEPLHTVCIPSRISVSDSPTLMVTVRDMTERMNFERQLAHIQKMEALSLLTAGIAHDFSNLLSLINGYADLLIQEAGPDSPLQDKLKCVLSAGKSAVSLTKRLLSLGRKRDMDMEQFDLPSEIKRVYGFISKGLPKNISFHLELPDESLFVMADSSMLQQTVMNLCLNARDAMPSGGEMTLSLRKQEIDCLPPCAPKDAAPGPYAFIEVSDTGPGVPDQIKDKIFDPFFTTKPDGKGSGLGLPMVDRVARGHNGWVQFESVPGKGASFRVLLPLTKRLQAAKEQPSKAYKHKRKDRLDSILVLDKDEPHLAMLSYFLEKEGYKVCPSGSERSALRQMEDSGAKFKLAIIDHDSCHADASKLRKLMAERFPHIKTLAIVSSASPAPAGGDILMKPFSIRDLLQAIDAIS